MRPQIQELRDWDGALFKVRAGLYTSLRDLEHEGAVGEVGVQRYELDPEKDAVPYWDDGRERHRWPHHHYWQWQVHPPGIECAAITDGAWYGTKGAAVVAALAYVHEGTLEEAKYHP